MPLDLSFARTLAEQQMADRCSIFRDPQGPLDDTLNATTLELAPVGVTTIATDVPCLVSELLVRDQGRTEGERQTYRRRWQVSVPLSTPPNMAGDIVQFTLSGNPDLLNRRVRVYDIDTSSLRSRRLMKCEDETGTLRQ